MPGRNCPIRFPRGFRVKGKGEAKVSRPSGRGVRLEVFEGDELEGVDVGGFENDWWSEIRFEGFGPAGNAEAPAIAGIEPGKLVFGDRGGEIVAAGLREEEEFFRHDGADRVEALVIRTRTAVAVAVESGERGSAAGLERGSEDVGGHGWIADCGFWIAEGWNLGAAVGLVGGGGVGSRFGEFGGDGGGVVVGGG